MVDIHDLVASRSGGTRFTIWSKSTQVIVYTNNPDKFKQELAGGWGHKSLAYLLLLENGNTWCKKRHSQVIDWFNKNANKTELIRENDDG